MLIQLKNGDWIDPNDVHGIKVRSGHVHCPPFKTCCWVEIELQRLDTLSSTQISFDEMEKAIAYRDELAAQVNAAKAKTFDSCVPWSGVGKVTITEGPPLSEEELQNVINSQTGKPTYRTDPLL